MRALLVLLCTFLLLPAVFANHKPTHFSRRFFPRLEIDDYCIYVKNLTGPVIISHDGYKEVLETNWEALQRVCAFLPKLGEPKRVFHWGPVDQCIPPAVLGYFPNDMLQWLVSHPGDNIAQGGFYVSDDPQDTKVYGVCRMDITLPRGLPVLDHKLVSNVTEIMGIDRLTRVKTALLGTVIPFVHSRYAGNQWSVIHSTLPLLNVTSGTSAHFNFDFFWGTFGRMFPRWTGTLSGPKVEAVNTISATLRRFVMAFVVSGDMVTFADATARRPDAPWEAVVPGSTPAQWDLAEQRFADLFGAPFSSGMFDCNQPNEAALVDAFVNQFVPFTMAAITQPVSDWGQVLRAEGYEEVLYTSSKYLQFLRASPFVTVASYAAVSTSPDAFKVTVRGISAQSESDWIKLVQRGIISESDPILKLLRDPTVSNKTQLLIHSTLRGLASPLKFLSISTYPDILSALHWLAPFSEALVPRWASRAMLNTIGNIRINCPQFMGVPMMVYASNPEIFYSYFNSTALVSFRGAMYDTILNAVFDAVFEQAYVSSLMSGVVVNTEKLSEMMDWDQVLNSMFSSFGLPTQKLPWTKIIRGGSQSPLGEAIQQRNWPFIIESIFS